MKSFVTGGTGFLGSHIIDACLKREDEVVALVRSTSNTEYLDTLPEVKQVVGGLSDQVFLQKILRGVDTVYHSAARVLDYGSREQFYETNVLCTEQLLKAARNAGVKHFVFVSSPSIIMNGSDQVNIDESEPYSDHYLNLYSETKAIAEQKVLAANTDGFITCAIRPRGIWGPRDLQGAMPKMVKKMKLGKLPNVSGGRQILASTCYCENAAEACILAARSDKVGGKAYFVADEEPVDVWPFCDQLADHFGVPRVNRSVNPKTLWKVASVIEFIWRIPFLSHRYPPPLTCYLVSLLSHNATYDLSAAQRDFNYKPIVGLATGLKRIDEWLGDGGTEEFIRYA